MTENQWQAVLTSYHCSKRSITRSRHSDLIITQNTQSHLIIGLMNVGCGKNHHLAQSNDQGIDRVQAEVQLPRVTGLSCTQKHLVWKTLVTSYHRLNYDLLDVQSTALASAALPYVRPALVVRFLLDLKKFYKVVLTKVDETMMYLISLLFKEERQVSFLQLGGSFSQTLELMFSLRWWSCAIQAHEPKSPSVDCFYSLL